MKFGYQLVLLIALLAAFKASAEVAVIVNPSNAQVLSDKQIARMFMGKLKSYDNGQTVVAINAKGNSSSRKEFEQKVLKKSSAQVKAYWSKLIFTGKGTPPKELTSAQQIIETVATEPGAIGYVDASAVTTAVKVLKTY